MVFPPSHTQICILSPSKPVCLPPHLQPPYFNQWHCHSPFTYASNLGVIVILPFLSSPTPRGQRNTAISFNPQGRHEAGSILALVSSPHCPCYELISPLHVCGCCRQCLFHPSHHSFSGCLLLIRRIKILPFLILNVSPTLLSSKM